MSMFDHPDAVQAALQTGFGGAAALVIGDLILDRTMWGEVERISPEAPVPVVRVVRQTEAAGGAANVAVNLAGLGLRVKIAGLAGADAAQAPLLDALRAAGVSASAVVSLAGWPTTVKTRIIGGHQHMLRLDVENPGSVTPEATARLRAACAQALDDASLKAVVLSDYAKGALDPRVCRLAIDAARERGMAVLAAPRGADVSQYAGATALSINRTQLAAALGASPDDAGVLLDGCRRLRQSLDLDFLALTRSEHGITLVDAGGIHHVPASAREVFDVSGAGDTVLACLAAGLIGGLSRLDAVRLANLAAGIVIGKLGTVAVERAELLAELSTRRSLEQVDKICDLDALLKRVAGWRAQGERIVFTNGCFDLLHAGHVSYLERAHLDGHRLIVGLNTDRSVRRLKGPQRPIIREGDRARVLAGLAAVDAVILFDEDTPTGLIEAIRPDVLAKGNDYTEEQVVGGHLLKAWGGRVMLVPVVEGRSTSHIIRQMSRD